MSDDQISIAATTLNAATQRGDLHAAYSLLTSRSKEDAHLIALKAGFWVRQAKDKDFWPSLQTRVAAACLGGQSGYEHSAACDPPGGSN